MVYNVNDLDMTNSAIFLLRGRLGNILYQIACGLTYAKKYNKKLYFFKGNGGGWLSWYDSYEELFSRFDFIDKLPEKFIHVKEIEPTHEYALLIDNGDMPILFNGYWQDWRYIDFEYVKPFLMPTEQMIENIKQRIGDYEDSVFISVRHGADYQRCGTALPAEWYENAYNTYFKGKKAIISADDVEWAEKNINIENKYVIKDSDKKEKSVENLFLGILCNNFIIYNGTFGIWSAYLGEKENSKVIYPSDWFGKGSPITCRPYKDNWIKMGKEKINKNIAIIHYNTPLVTDALVRSVNKFVTNSKIYIFDNSDKAPFENKYDNVTVFDNTEGKIINFDVWVNSHEYLDENNRNENNFASDKHAYSVEKCIELIDDDFILMDSDILLKKDISEFYNSDFLSVGHYEVFNGKVERICPFLCYINVKMMKKYGLHFYDEEHSSGFRKSDIWYDTGSLLYINSLKYGYKEVDINKYMVHLMHGSWGGNEDGVNSFLLKKAPLYSDANLELPLLRCNNLQYCLFGHGSECTIFTTSYHKRTTLKNKDFLDFRRFNLECYNGYHENDHHYKTKFFYNIIIPELSKILNFDFDINDFHKVDFKSEDGEYDLSYLYPNTDSNFTIYVEDKEPVQGDYNVLLGIGVNDLFYNTYYHRLFRATHKCCKIINNNSKNNKVICVSGDSHMAPVIPILANYYKEVVFLDNREGVNSHRHWFENTIFNDVLVEYYEGATWDTLINNLK